MASPSGRLLLLVAFLVAAAFRGEAKESGYVSFCDIVKNPEQYDQAKVLTSGILLAGPELSRFDDPACPDGEDRDAATLPVAADNKVQASRSWKQLDELLRKHGRAFVVVRGVFDAYKRYEGALPPDPRLQEILKKGNSRFGHNNFARFRLRIESAELVLPVAD